MSTEHFEEGRGHHRERRKEEQKHKRERGCVERSDETCKPRDDKHRSEKSERKKKLYEENKDYLNGKFKRDRGHNEDGDYKGEKDYKEDGGYKEDRDYQGDRVYQEDRERKRKTSRDQIESSRRKRDQSKGRAKESIDILDDDKENSRRSKKTTKKEDVEKCKETTKGKEIKKRERKYTDEWNEKSVDQAESIPDVRERRDRPKLNQEREDRKMDRKHEKSKEHTKKTSRLKEDTHKKEKTRHKHRETKHSEHYEKDSSADKENFEGSTNELTKQLKSAAERPSKLQKSKETDKYIKHEQKKSDRRKSKHERKVKKKRNKITTRLYHSDSELEKVNKKSRKEVENIADNLSQKIPTGEDRLINVDALYNLFYRDTDIHNESHVIKDAMKKKMYDQEKKHRGNSPETLLNDSLKPVLLDQSNVRSKLIKVLFQRVKDLLSETERLRSDRKSLSDKIESLSKQVEASKEKDNKQQAQEEIIKERLEVLADEMKITAHGTSFREEVQKILYNIQDKYESHWKEHETKIQKVQSQAEDDIQGLMKNIVAKYVQLNELKERTRQTQNIEYNFKHPQQPQEQLQQPQPHPQQPQPQQPQPHSQQPQPHPQEQHDPREQSYRQDNRWLSPTHKINQDQSDHYKELLKSEIKHLYRNNLIEEPFRLQEHHTHDTSKYKHTDETNLWKPLQMYKTVTDNLNEKTPSKTDARQPLYIDVCKWGVETANTDQKSFEKQWPFHYTNPKTEEDLLLKIARPTERESNSIEEIQNLSQAPKPRMFTNYLSEPDGKDSTTPPPSVSDGGKNEIGCLPDSYEPKHSLPSENFNKNTEPIFKDRSSYLDYLYKTEKLEEQKRYQKSNISEKSTSEYCRNILGSKNTLTEEYTNIPPRPDSREFWRQKLMQPKMAPNDNHKAIQNEGKSAMRKRD